MTELEQELFSILEEQWDLIYQTIDSPFLRQKMFIGEE